MLTSLIFSEIELLVNVGLIRINLGIEAIVLF